MVGMMLWLNWRYALVALAMAPLLFWTVFRYTNRIRSAARAARRSDGLLASLAHETSARSGSSRGSRRRACKKPLSGAQPHSLDAYLESVRYQSRVAPLVDVLAGAGAALVIWYGARGVARRRAHDRRRDRCSSPT